MTGQEAVDHFRDMALNPAIMRTSQEVVEQVFNKGHETRNQLKELDTKQAFLTRAIGFVEAIRAE